MKLTKKTGLLIIIINLIALQSNTAYAALQANQNAPTSKNRNTWITEIRQMENLGGTLGLNQNINADLTSQGESNNIDIHMQKNTEYGAMAILSASDYGKSSKIENGETTTGNESGVVIPYNKEWTASQYTDFYGVLNYSARYYDDYGKASEYKRFRGDAMHETNGWHGTSSIYMNTYNGPYYMYYGRVNSYNAAGPVVRGVQGVFYYNNRAKYSSPYQTSWAYGEGVWYGDYGDDIAIITNAWTTRAVIVNGEGI